MTPTPEDRRREAPDGPEDDCEMRQEVHIDQLHIPTSTKIVSGLLVTVLGGLVTWNLLETIANGKQQAQVWIELGKQQARQDIADVRLNALESRVGKLEDKR